MPENHQDPLTRYYANHRDALSRAHRALLGGIHDEAVAFTEEHPEVAHDPGMEDVRKMPPNEHLAAVKRLHAGESAGPKPHENETNDIALGDRAKRMQGHTRHKPSGFEVIAHAVKGY